METYYLDFAGTIEFEASADGEAQTKAREYKERLKGIGKMVVFAETTATKNPPERDYLLRFLARHDCPGFEP